ncbi:MarR family winged helix-turn-helix transcriptional regulator [Chitinophaga pinensis]|uniref:Transcriptional regulator, MarR family n=1 Tax=Chitinophaga pinensis (strain ATCC 43595 / DSM 2588 / LMG 13176 / NBRC 15968 / NCIMB 11800 / UQM 2034) TaxID=485918 RepID=A0A979GAK6_CHIPD|nr:MarR family transcriptional regulator [Chitinophaga pinensis]ACU63792.1 transcriptional regulator, MarR family [Chitinophaga pinensis DSM 2588]
MKTPDNIIHLKALGTVVSNLRDAMRHFVQRRLREQNIDLTFEMLQVINTLSEKGEINQQEIANLLNKDKTSITYLLDNLSKRGLVRRVEDPGDRRNKIIHLTEAGHKITDLLAPIVEELHEKASKGLSVDYLKNVTKSLQVIQGNLELE